MDALTEIMIDHGYDIGVRSGFPNNVRVVDVQKWREEFYRRTQGSQATKQKAFSRLLNDASGVRHRGYIGYKDELVWIIDNART
jgi:hypothetical protein